MTRKVITRRDFIKTAGVALGAAGAAGLMYNAFDAPDAVQPEIEFTNTSYGENMMSKKILVAYASRGGSTVGVAEAIGKTLAESGAAVDVRHVDSVSDLGGYDAVVAGSAIQGGEWLPEALQFVQAHRAELARKPFAAFLVCMTLSMKNGAYREHVSTWLDPVRALARPVSSGLFAGALDIRKIPSFGDRLKFRLSVLAGVWSEGDHRDWPAIRQWAQGLPPLLLKQG
ncbi:MAG: flavodoxin domain-containing protein [Chloroflexi bacterium]|nr:flavodoxin domain-containing protein [Chloroflexota bacterium]